MVTSESRCSLSMNIRTRLFMADDNQDQNPLLGDNRPRLPRCWKWRTSRLSQISGRSFRPMLRISTSTTGVATQWSESIRSAKHQCDYDKCGGQRYGYRTDSITLLLAMQLITNALLSSTVVCTRNLSKSVKARFDYALHSLRPVQVVVKLYVYL
jgi:hypothetical protein